MTEKLESMENAAKQADALPEEAQAVIVAFAQGLAAGTKISQGGAAQDE